MAEQSTPEAERATQAEVDAASAAEEVAAEVIDGSEEASNGTEGSTVEGATEDAAPEPTNDELVAKAQAEAKEWQDKYLRLHAEWDTYRRRTAEQREAERVRAGEKLVESLLPVIDDFERTIDYAESNGEAGLMDGVKAVRS